MSASQISSVLAPANGAAPGSADRPELQKTLRASVLESLRLASTANLSSISEAIRDQLAKADPNAVDPVADVMKTLNGALDRAARSLADQGIDSETIDAAVAQFRGNLSQAIDSLTKDAAAAAAASTSAIAARHVVREKFSLDIVTAENDRVSIRFRSSEVTEFAAASAATPNGSALVAGAHVISRGQLRIEVKGDLNDAELAAIGALLDKVNGIAQDFFGGDVQAAFDAASRVDFDSQALEGFNLRLRYSESLAYARKYADTAAASQPLPPVSVTPPATTAPVTAAPASSPLAEPVGETTAAPAAPVTDVPAETATPEAAGSAKTTMLSFAKDALARLDTVSDAGSLRFSLSWKVEFLLTAISATAKPEAQPAANALGNTLRQEVAGS